MQYNLLLVVNAKKLSHFRTRHCSLPLLPVFTSQAKISKGFNTSPHLKFKSLKICPSNKLQFLANEGLSTSLFLIIF